MCRRWTATVIRPDWGALPNSVARAGCAGCAGCAGFAPRGGRCATRAAAYRMPSSISPGVSLWGTRAIPAAIPCRMFHVKHAACLLPALPAASCRMLGYKDSGGERRFSPCVISRPVAGDASVPSVGRRLRTPAGGGGYVSRGTSPLPPSSLVSRRPTVSAAWVGGPNRAKERHPVDRVGWVGTDGMERHALDFEGVSVRP